MLQVPGRGDDKISLYLFFSRLRVVVALRNVHVVLQILGVLVLSYHVCDLHSYFFRRFDEYKLRVPMSFLDVPIFFFAEKFYRFFPVNLPIE